jgi:uncharacterized protein YjbJ (UPF0337 family)
MRPEESSKRQRVVGPFRNAIVSGSNQVRRLGIAQPGAIKDTAGKLTGDKELQSEGKVDKAKGDAHNAAGSVKDAARDLTK